ncbi:MAG: nickel pincer cofactor biosynthesis protein LarC [Oscillospiraceae bacterium]|nr:nickel pincer cofactor biosynthesis protein LarC [Oscillospiraceae bacterium]
MKTVYFECAMGAAGDMLMGALYELCPVKEKFLDDMNRLLPGVTLAAEPVRRQGIAGTHMRVLIHGREEGDGQGHEHGHGHHHAHHHHEHRSLADIEAMINAFPLPQPVLENAGKTYTHIAQAESAAHGVDTGEVHFHEVGTLDAVMDVTGVCYLLYLLAPEAVCASAVTVGSGTVRTAHGLLPVPAPATARLLTGVPVTAGDIQAELCTPTGAALLRTFVGNWGPMPDGVIQGCGHGCGTKDFPRANCLRAFLIDSSVRAETPNDAVTELKANIDDMTGEALGYAMDRLLEAGALDVSCTPVYMKKNRPGVVLTCLCRPADGDRLAAEMLRHTSTFGVRRTDCARYTMAVSSETVETAYGPISRKAGAGYGMSKSKPEYDAMARAARDRGIPLAVVRSAFDQAEQAK